MHGGFLGGEFVGNFDDGAEWIADHAGPLAQLDDIFAEYEQAQLRAARAEITDGDHRKVDLLLAGHLEAS